MSKQIAATKKYYNQKAVLWSNAKTNSFHHEKQFREIVKLWPEKARIIDIGCANGIHVPLFLGIGRLLKYVGVDISKTFLKIAATRYPQLTFLEADISNSDSLPKKKFDGFWAGAILMHIPFSEWDVMFQNIEKLCKPKSYGYITLPTEHPSKDRAADDPRHFTLLSSQEQVDFIKNKGWKIIKKGVTDGTTKNAIWQWYIVQI